MDDRHAAEVDPAAQSGRRHVRTGMILTAVQVAGLGFSVIQDVFAARLFGAHREFDGYLAAWIVPITLGTVVASGLQNALVPHFAQRRTDAGIGAAWRLASETLGVAVVVFAVVSVVGLAAAHLVVGFTTARAAPEASRVALELYPLGFVFAFLGLAVGLLAGFAATVGRFLIAPILSNAVSAVPVLFLWLGGTRLGILCLPLGLVVGSVFQAGVLGWMLWRMGLRLRLPDRDGLRRLRAMGKESSALGLSQIPILAMPIAERHFASAAGEGAITRLYYAGKFFSAGSQLLWTALAFMGMSLLSAYLARGETERFRRAFSLLLRVAFYLSAAFLVGLTISGGPLVQVLFEHGRFDHYDTLVVAHLLFWYLAGLFYVLVNSIITAALLAHRRVFILPVANFFGLACYLACAIWGGALEPDPVRRLAMAYGVGLNATLVPLIAYAVGKKLVEGRAFVGAAARTAVFVPLLAVPFWLVRRWLEHSGCRLATEVLALAVTGVSMAAVALLAVDREVSGRFLAAAPLRRREPVPAEAAGAP